MRRNATEKEDWGSLSDDQVKVLEAILGGAPVAAAAATAGVNRSTVYRWLRQDHEFRAALNRARTAFREAAFARLDALSDKAIEILVKSLNAPNADPRVAIGVLRGLGLLTGSNQPGSDDSEVLREAAVAERAASLGESSEQLFESRLKRMMPH